VAQSRERVGETIGSPRPMTSLPENWDSGFESHPVHQNNIDIS